jgi:hypothetical protein
MLFNRTKDAREKGGPKSGPEDNKKNQDEREPPSSRQNSAATQAPLSVRSSDAPAKLAQLIVIPLSQADGRLIGFFPKTCLGPGVTAGASFSC